MLLSRIRLLAVAFALVTVSFASADVAPKCPGWEGQTLEVINAEVAHWKRTTQNQFRERARVKGPITRVYPQKNGHIHFQIQIGSQADSTLEVIYNEDFGAMESAVQIGAMVEACGDYITATDWSGGGQYPPSPDGAIIHWVHVNPSPKGHPSGYTMIGDKLFGTDTRNAGPKKNHGPKQGK